LLRVGDQERDAVAEILRRRHVEGRLDAEEFNTRIDRCLAAKTYADLDQLIADLPLAPGGSQVGYPRWRPWPGGFALLPLVVIAIAVAGGHAWIAIPVIFFIIRPLLWRRWSADSARVGWGGGSRRMTRTWG
jgi:hypothetical protein